MATTRKAAKATRHLTDDQLVELSEALKEGKRATVYLREPLPGLGLEAGASARVVSIDGNTLIVRPRGVDDEIPFEAEELRRTKAAPPEPPKPAKSQAPRKRAPKSQSQAVPGKPAPVKEDPVEAPAASRALAAPRRKSAPKSAACAITLRADETGGWSVEVERSSGQQLKPASVTPDAVLRAVEALGHPAALRTAQTALDAARDAAARRVEELKQKLLEAESALHSLNDKE
ncbi:NfeD family protein [Hoyosella subflava]|nr:NfeD family protein [Hoyosella subflava]